MPTNNEVVIVPSGALIGDVVRFDGTRWQVQNELTRPIKVWALHSTDPDVGSNSMQGDGWGDSGNGTGTFARVDGPWGGIRLTTSASLNNIEYVFTRATFGSTDVHKLTKLSQSPVLFMRAGLVQTATTQVILGAAETLNTSTPDGWYFKYDSSVSANWYAVTRAAGVETSTDTTIAADTSLASFLIVGTTTTVKFYINGTLGATHTTNIDTAVMGLAFQIKTLAAATKSLDAVLVSLRQGMS